MKEKLIKVWETYSTKEMAKVFQNYMISKGINKRDERKKDNSNTYIIHRAGWNRIQCYYHKENMKYANENLHIVLRKEAGNYMIIERKSVRVFEVDYRGVTEYNEKLLCEIMTEHKELFDMLFSKIN